MLICSPQLGLSPGSNLGGEVYDLEVLKGLDQEEVKSLIILPLGKKHLPLKNAKFYFLPTPVVYPPWLFNFLILPYLFYLYHKFHFQILRVHNPYFVGPAAVLLKAFFPEVKIVASYLHLEQTNKLYDFLDRRLLSHYDQIITISQSTKHDIINTYSKRKDKIIVIPCGVDKKYHPEKKNDALLEKFNLKNKKVLIYLGQLIERKNIPFLFEVLKKLPDNYVLLICGDGPLKTRLQNMIKDENLNSKAILTGFISESEKVDYYNLADIFVYPSTKEGFGLSVCEALACGKKVLASDIPPFREIKSNSLLLLPKDLNVWASTILSMKNSTTNKIFDYSWKEASKKYYQALKELL